MFLIIRLFETDYYAKNGIDYSAVYSEKVAEFINEKDARDFTKGREDFILIDLDNSKILENAALEIEHFNFKELKPEL